MSPDVLDEEITAFLTRLVPYDLDPFQRAQLRAAVRLTAAAHLFGALLDLICRDTVTCETVTAAIQAAINAGIDYQREQITAAHAAPC